MFECAANGVVASPAGYLLPMAWNQGCEHRSSVVAIAAQLGQIHMQRRRGEACFYDFRDTLEPIDSRDNLVIDVTEPCACLGQHGRLAVELRQRLYHGGNTRVGGLEQSGDLASGLALQRVVQRRFPVAVDARAPRQRAENADVAEVHVDLLDAGQLQGLEHEGQDLAVAFEAGVTVKLRPHLHR